MPSAVGLGLGIKKAAAVYLDDVDVEIPLENHIIKHHAILRPKAHSKYLTCNQSMHEIDHIIQDEGNREVLEGPYSPEWEVDVSQIKECLSSQSSYSNDGEVAEQDQKEVVPEHILRRREIRDKMHTQF